MRHDLYGRMRFDDTRAFLNDDFLAFDGSFETGFAIFGSGVTCSDPLPKIFYPATELLGNCHPGDMKAETEAQSEKHQ